MSFTCSIVGLPNVGKSTLFNALTKSRINAKNFPFCTIEPNTGIVIMPDHRLNKLAEIVNPKRVLPTTIEFIDIAGLVEGASKGEGLGNKFLANIRETDAIIHVVRCFKNDHIVHVTNKIDPKEDINIINIELIMADLESCEKQLQRVIRVAKSNNQTAKLQKKLLKKIIAHLENGNPIRSLQELNDSEKKFIKNLHLLTTKPFMYIANVDEDGFIANHYLDVVHRIARSVGAVVVTLCNQLESDITELEDEECNDILSDLDIAKSGINHVIHASYKLLGLQTFFTVGAKEVRAWPVKIGTTGLQAAGVVHTDFARGFICAEVTSYADFIEYKGEQGTKEAGKLRIEGAEYLVQDGNVIHFRFNV